MGQRGNRKRNWTGSLFHHVGVNLTLSCATYLKATVCNAARSSRFKSVVILGVENQNKTPSSSVKYRHLKNIIFLWSAFIAWFIFHRSRRWRPLLSFSSLFAHLLHSVRTDAEQLQCLYPATTNRKRLGKPLQISNSPHYLFTSRNPSYAICSVV